MRLTGRPVAARSTTMRDSTTIFDQEDDASAAADLTRAFWGDGAGWIVPERTRTRAEVLQVRHGEGLDATFDLDHTPVSLRGIRDGFAAFRPQRRWRDDSTGPVERTREHGSPRVTRTAIGGTVALTPLRPSAEALPHRDASIAELAAGSFDDVPAVPAHDDDLIPLVPVAHGARRRRGGADPMVVRIAMIAAALLVAIPLALFLRSSNEPTVETDVDVPPPAAEEPVDEGTSPGAAPAAPAIGGPEPLAAAADPSNVEVAVAASAAPAAAALSAAVAPTDDTASAGAPLTESADAERLDDVPEAGIATPATVEEVAERTMPDCSRTYTAGPGDSWYRIADAAGVTPKALIDQNRATLDTVIFPGSEICLPPGAAMPSPPTTAPATAERPAASPATTVASATTPPATAPTTTAAPPPVSSRAEVQELIREIWPDELEERALEIARRESNFRSNADNGWCCVGVFQLYWTAHRNWLDDFGIHSRDDLKDARKNITAAYGLYQRSGGWGPWGG